MYVYHSLHPDANKYNTLSGLAFLFLNIADVLEYGWDSNRQIFAF